MNSEKSIKEKLIMINLELQKIEKLLSDSVLKDNMEKRKIELILKELSDIYINTQLCFNNLKYVNMKNCNHIFVKRETLNIKKPINYCLCCGLNNYYECIENKNYILNQEDKILKVIYEKTKTNGIQLFEYSLDIEDFEKIFNLYKENKSLTREQLVTKLKYNQKRLTKK